MSSVDPDELARALAARAASGKNLLVGIDGFDGIGKTSRLTAPLAANLAKNRALVQHRLDVTNHESRITIHTPD